MADGTVDRVALLAALQVVRRDLERELVDVTPSAGAVVPVLARVEPRRADRAPIAVCRRRPSAGEPSSFGGACVLVGPRPTPRASAR